MKHSRVAEALVSLCPGKKFTLWGDDTATIVIHDDMVLPSDAELQAECDRLDARQPALDEIVRLEGEITPRRVREAILGTDNNWLSNQEALIAAERAKL